MNWRQKIKKDAYGEEKMILQVRKWWMPFFVDCWYKVNEPDGDGFYQLSTSIKYPPNIETIDKKDLYYWFFRLVMKKI